MRRHQLHRKPGTSRGTSARKRRGVAAVEFAIVAPIFFMLVVGIIEVGRALMVQQVLINASRVGARQAVMPSATHSTVVDAATGYAAGVGVAGVDVDVSPDPAAATAGTAITVKTSINFTKVSWLPAPWIMGGKTLTSSSIMRKEGF